MPAGPVMGGLNKGTVMLVRTLLLEKAALPPAPPALTLKLVYSVPLPMSLVLFKLFPLHWSYERVSL